MKDIDKKIDFLNNVTGKEYYLQIILNPML